MILRMYCLSKKEKLSLMLVRLKVWLKEKLKVRQKVRQKVRLKRENV